MTKLKPFAFVLMPFAKEFDDVYKLGIKAVAKDLGVVAERVDEQIFSESMLERIYRQIDAADFVIADMTGKNPNVFYEVGYAHAKGKLCTLITRTSDDIPFDLKHHRHLVYGGSIQSLRDMLKAEIAWLKAETDKLRSSTLTFTVKSAIGTLIKDKDWRDRGSLELVFDIHNNSERKTPEIEAVYLYTAKNWKFSQSNEECPSTDTDLQDYERQHFLRIPVNRLSPGAWAQIKCIGERTMWMKYLGGERKEEYRLAGRVLLETVTSEGSFRETINLDVTFEEFPF